MSRCSSAVLVALVWSLYFGKTATASLTSRVPVVESHCGFAIVDPSSHTFLGWALLQPTQSTSEASRFPKMLSFAFGPDDSLAITDRQDTVIVDPVHPHIIQARLSGTNKILGYRSRSSLIVTGGFGRIEEWSLTGQDPEIQSSVARSIETARSEWDSTEMIPLGYLSLPRGESRAFISVGRQDNRHLVLMRAQDNAFVPSFSRPLLRNVYFGLSPDHSVILEASLGPKHIVLRGFDTEHSSELFSRTILHDDESEVPKGEGYRQIAISPDRNFALIGPYLVNQPMSSKIAPKVVRLEIEEVNSPLVRFSSDSRWVAIPPGADERLDPTDRLRIFDSYTGKLKASIMLNGLVKISDVQFSPSGDYLAVSGYSQYPQNSFNRAALYLFSMNQILRR